MGSRNTKGKSVLQGDHETQESQGEADLHKHKNDCEKNPGHINFIPVNTFNINHLPVGHRDIDLYDAIKAASELTVRVDVRMVSPHRPDFWPKTNTPYPFASNRGVSQFMVGSGRVWNVTALPDKSKNSAAGSRRKCKVCQYDDCQKSGSRTSKWYEIEVWTARHVVYDTYEANHTTLRLFHDSDENCPIVTLSKVKVSDVKFGEDWSVLTATTCDEILASRLHKAVRQWRDLWKKIADKYKSSREKDKLAIVVSHPHGCPKQISIGQWESKELLARAKKRCYFNKYVYYTATCKGSSGAAVYIVGYLNQPVHSGCLSGMNYSGACGVD